MNDFFGLYINFWAKMFDFDGVIPSKQFWITVLAAVAAFILVDSLVGWIPIVGWVFARVFGVANLIAAASLIARLYNGKK